MTESKVYLIIKSMKTKSCELNDILTNILKALLPKILPSITRIVNTSLDLGKFSHTWKIALVCPLLKKLGLELIKSNFRPVRNLTFISKVV